MVHGPLVFLAGMIASDFATGLEPGVQAPPGLPYSRDTVEAQTAVCLGGQARVAAAAGTSLDRAAQLWTFLTDLRQQGAPAGPAARLRRLGPAGGDDNGGAEPDRARRQRGDRCDPGGPWCRAHRAAMPGLPDPADALGASRAVRVGPFIFLSSLAAVDEQGAIAGPARVTPGLPFFQSAIKRQTAHILRTLQTLLDEAGSSLARS